MSAYPCCCMCETAKIKEYKCERKICVLMEKGRQPGKNGVWQPQCNQCETGFACGTSCATETIFYAKLAPVQHYKMLRT